MPNNGNKMKLMKLALSCVLSMSTMTSLPFEFRNFDELTDFFVIQIDRDRTACTLATWTCWDQAVNTVQRAHKRYHCFQKGILTLQTFNFLHYFDTHWSMKLRRNMGFYEALHPSAWHLYCMQGPLANVDEISTWDVPLSHSAECHLWCISR